MGFLIFGAIILGIILFLALGALAALGVILMTALEIIGYMIIASIAFLLLYAALFWIKVDIKRLRLTSTINYQTILPLLCAK